MKQRGENKDEKINEDEKWDEKMRMRGENEDEKREDKYMRLR